MLRSFEDVRSIVESDWRRDQVRVAKAGYLARLREKYTVQPDGEAARWLTSDAQKARWP
jgi:hypothetical protein